LGESVLTGKNLPSRQGSASSTFEFLVSLCVFVGIGWLVDSWLGSAPIAVVVFALLGILGNLARAWYAYDAEMNRLESQLMDSKRVGSNVSSESVELDEES
jgi:Flp pilus assembly protein TadB